MKLPFVPYQCEFHLKGFTKSQTKTIILLFRSGVQNFCASDFLYFGTYNFPVKKGTPINWNPFFNNLNLNPYLIKL